MAGLPPTGISNLLPRGLPRIPTAAKTYIDSVLLGDTSPITEKNFSPDELKAIRELTAVASWPPRENERPSVRGAVQYDTYNKAPTYDRNARGVLGLMSTPMGNVSTTLGQFNYKHDEKGGTVVTDKYKFNPGGTNLEWWKNKSLLDKTKAAVDSPYAALRAYAQHVLPAGSPNARPVNVYLPPMNPHR